MKAQAPASSLYHDELSKPVALRYPVLVSQLAVLVAIVLAVSTPVRPLAQDPGPGYKGVGSGHYVRGVTEDGQFVTLEDASRWEIDPRDRFRTVEWAADEGVTVRRATSETGFDYQLDNTDRDEGADARYLPR